MWQPVQGVFLSLTQWRWFRNKWWLTQDEFVTVPHHFLLFLAKTCERPFSPAFFYVQTVTLTFQATLLMPPWQVPRLRRPSALEQHTQDYPRWCHTLASFLFSSLSFCCSLFDLPSLHLYGDDDNVRIHFCHSSLLHFHPAMSPGKYEDELFLSIFLSVFLAPPFPSPSLSLPDIKSTVIRLLVNLWWPRHLTAELHQRLKNTESKWGCNGSEVGPWPLIELKDMGKREKERGKYWVTGNRGWEELEGVY